MTKQIKEYLALALDNVTSKQQIENLIHTTADYLGVYKIGLEQFVRFGPGILEFVKTKSGNKLFLDLKLHDIPNTVAQAVTAAADYHVDYLTIHTSGGREMMTAAAEAAARVSRPPRLIGVTVLTSIDQNTLNRDLRITGDIAQQVEHLAAMAVLSGMNGIVCSAADLPAVRKNLPASFEVITPGIRPALSETGDQKRVATPQQAIKNGATLLVVGRPITAADDPADAARQIYKSVSDALAVA